MKQQYHHGNLKQELIEKAIEIISINGVEGLSLRSLSKQLDVSHNAIYRHFASKNRLIEVAKEHIITSLKEYLLTEIKGLDYTNPQTINKLSYSYIDFFKNHPAYFDFIYSGKTACKIVFTLDRAEDNYPPYEIFANVCISLISRYKLSKEEGLKRLVKYWALMQGMVSLMISPDIELDGDWQEFSKGIF